MTQLAIPPASNCYSWHHMSTRLRIAVVAACPFPAPRGTPIRIHRIANELGRRGHDVDVFTYHLGSTTEGGAFRIHRIANIRTYRKHSPGPTYQKLLILDPLLAIKLVAAVRKRRYDVIHAHHAEGLLAALPAHRIFGIPVVFDVHTLLEAELPYYRMGLSERALRRIGAVIDARLPGHADHVIAVSEDIRAALTRKSGIAPGAVSVIPNGVEEAFFAAAIPTQTRVGSGPSVVYAGNLAEYQGIEFLLRAFAAAHQRRPDVVLQLLTESPFDAYESMARTLGVRESITIAKASLEDLPARLAAADVAVNPRIECSGLPQKLLNYMAAGCPIVTFAGSAKHVTHEKNALIVADRDVDALADAALRLIADKPLARRLGAEARLFARTELGWPRAAEHVEAVYERVIGATSRT
jgi:glycosyltransferase involved in cell wall biosynthesis